MRHTYGICNRFWSASTFHMIILPWFSKLLIKWFIVKIPVRILWKNTIQNLFNSISDHGVLTEFLVMAYFSLGLASLMASSCAFSLSATPSFVGFLFGRTLLDSHYLNRKWEDNIAHLVELAPLPFWQRHHDSVSEHTSKQGSLDVPLWLFWQCWKFPAEQDYILLVSCVVVAISDIVPWPPKTLPAWWRLPRPMQMPLPPAGLFTTLIFFDELMVVCVISFGPTVRKLSCCHGSKFEVHICNESWFNPDWSFEFGTAMSRGKNQDSNDIISHTSSNICKFWKNELF